MSKIKELKRSSENNINVIEALEMLLDNNKTKYVEMFSKLVHNKMESLHENSGVREDLLNRIPTMKISEDISPLTLTFVSTILNWIETDIVTSFNQFCEYNERTLIERNDLTTYTSFDELICEINKVELKMINKEMEKQVVSLFNDDEWVVIKPLTFESSKKYGSNTKWCTTSVSNPEYFFRYTKNGILIYCINKKTGYKVAAFKDISDKEISFWNQKDSRIDSFDSELPDELIALLRKEFRECNLPNMSFIDIELREQEMKNNYLSNKVRNIEPMEGAVIGVQNRFEDDAQDPAPLEGLLDERGGIEGIYIGEVPENGHDEEIDEIGFASEINHLERGGISSEQIIEMINDHREERLAGRFIPREVIESEDQEEDLGQIRVRR